MLLTSFATVLGAWPITLDPIFSGLAWSLILSLLVSTLFTLVVVPMICFMAYENRCAEDDSWATNGSRTPGRTS